LVVTIYAKWQRGCNARRSSLNCRHAWWWKYVPNGGEVELCRDEVLWLYSF
jgi:hypothetical protein